MQLRRLKDISTPTAVEEVFKIKKKLKNSLVPECSLGLKKRTSQGPGVFVFIEGVIFQKGNSYIKVVVWYGDSRIQRFLMKSSHLLRNFQL